jgi:alpha-glucosidase (family GH31 glycosyl hydrolase)
MEDSDNSRCSSKDLNGIVSQCSLNVSTERGQNVLLHDRNITIEVTLDQQSRVIEENDNSAEAFDTSHEQESVNEFTPLTYKENGTLHSEIDVINKLSGSLETVNSSELNGCHVMTED